ncbi:MAG: hypothetical protein RBJ76_00730 [Stenomitos frigidus ULC029]
MRQGLFLVSHRSGQDPTAAGQAQRAADWLLSQAGMSQAAEGTEYSHKPQQKGTVRMLKQ